MRKAPFQAVVIREYPCLSDIFQNGDVITCYPEVLDEDIIRKAEYQYPVDADGNVLPRKTVQKRVNGGLTWTTDYDYTNFAKNVIVPAEIAPKGSFKDVILVSKDGLEYGGNMIINRIGYTPITDWLKRLEN